jgi:hypothetical protein
LLDSTTTTLSPLESLSSFDLIQETILPSVIVELRVGMKISLILAQTVRMGLLRHGLLAQNDERDCVGRAGREEKDTERNG